METQPEASRAYARRLYDRITAWYEIADRRAQLILTLDGVFVSFLVGSILSKPAELRAVTTKFGAETWVFLGAMTLALILSISFAIACLFSRFRDLRGAAHSLKTKPGLVAWYFPVVANTGEEEFMASVDGVDATIEAKTLADNAVRAAAHVVEKYERVNRGFLWAAVTLVLFLGAGVSYVVRVA